MLENLASLLKEQSILEKLKGVLKESTIKEPLETKVSQNPLEYTMSTIENQSLESLRLKNQTAIESMKSKHKESRLSHEEMQRIKNETGWSDEIIKAIRSWEEYEVYKKAGLEEREVNGRKCLVRNDIDWDQKDSMGRTNRERIQNGLSPINKDGETIELHHIGQKKDGPFAELTREEHQGNDSILHEKNKKSEIDRNEADKERIEHWKSRAKEV